MKNKRCFIDIGVFVLIALLVLYFLHAFLPCCRVLDALLSFLECVVAVVPTVILGVLAYQQNKHLAQQSASWERVNTKRPFFIIDSINFSGADGELKYNKSEYIFHSNADELPTFTIALKNVGEGPAFRITRDNECFGKMLPTEHFVKQDGLFEFTIRPRRFDTNTEYGHNGESNTEITIAYANILGKQYKQVITLEQTASPADELGSDYRHTVKIQEISEQHLREGDKL